MTASEIKTRVAMVVPNTCDPDYRVIKEAETLAAAGMDVRIYCIWKPGIGLPMREVLNGVTYIRREWNVVALIKYKLFGIPLPHENVRLKPRYVDEGDS